MTIALTDRGGFQEVLERKEASIERRRGHRFSLRLNCRVCPASTERVEFAGSVINISRPGILVGLDPAQIFRVLRPDDVVRVVVELRQRRVKNQNTKAISTRDWLGAPIEGLIQ
jgi:c-di-GMP-binding flagellar brake protein YcgR